MAQIWHFKSCTGKSLCYHRPIHKETWEESRINKKKQILAKRLTTLVHDEQVKKAEAVARALFLGGMSVERVLIKTEKRLYQRRSFRKRETAKRSGCQKRKERVSAWAGGLGLEIMG